MEPLFTRKLTEITRGEKAFGFKDQKGREVGYSWEILQAVYTPAEEGARSGWLLPEGFPAEHIVVNARPTRDGKGYGAFTGLIRCLTKDEACKQIARRSTAAYKRDLKKFGGAA